MTFKDYINAFLDERELSLSPVTVINYRRELEKASIELGLKEMKDIGFLDMKAYFVKLQKHGTNFYNSHLLKHGSLVQQYSHDKNYYDKFYQ